MTMLDESWKKKKSNYMAKLALGAQHINICRYLLKAKFSVDKDNSFILIDARMGRRDSRIY